MIDEEGKELISSREANELSKKAKVDEKIIKELNTLIEEECKKNKYSCLYKVLFYSNRMKENLYNLLISKGYKVVPLAPNYTICDLIFVSFIAYFEIDWDNTKEH